MNDILSKSIEACNRYKIAFCKFISSNDAGTTGAHQQGFYIPKNSWSLLFDSPGEKGTNKDKHVVIKWQDDFETRSRFIWYGQGTRSEYRITRLGQGFPFFTDEHVGSLLILVKVCDSEYIGYVLGTDDEIEGFLSAFALSASDTNNLIRKQEELAPSLEQLIIEYICSLDVDFPESFEVSRKAREFVAKIDPSGRITNADKKLLEWLNVEYSLFRELEHQRYRLRLIRPFKTVDEFIECANTLLNRRKSRAGKSLEHHLESMFTYYCLPFTKQARTEGNKRPDFIFPSERAYHNYSFSNDNLFFLGAKTTCKDRWRQVLNEADRIETKHLFTLQQGISANQLEEMNDYKVILVVPEQYKASFPEQYRDRIYSLEKFILQVKEKCS